MPTSSSARAALRACGSACGSESCVDGKCCASGGMGCKSAADCCGSAPCVNETCGGCMPESGACTQDQDCCLGWWDNQKCTPKVLGQSCKAAKECDSAVCDTNPPECAGTCCIELPNQATCAAHKNCVSENCVDGVCTCRGDNYHCDGDEQCCGKCVNDVCKPCGELGQACAGGICCEGQCIGGKCLASVGQP